MMTLPARVSPIASPWQIIVMSMMAGVTIANIYYCQPILAQIAASLHIATQQTAALPVWAQAGYGCGLFFIAPLGDLLNRKKLILLLQLGMLLALLAMTQAPSLQTLALSSFCIGLFGVSVQILVPMAASLASSTAKGKVVGMVFTGSLTGILAARVISGLIAQWLGWRWVFGISMVLIMLASLLFILFLPSVQATHRSSYHGLLRSTLHQAARFRALRRLSLLGALAFGAFCAFWTTLTLKLSAAPFHYDSGAIGLFGLLALAGTLVAPAFGKLADRSDPRRTQIYSVLLMLLGVLALQLWQNALLSLIVATLLLDIGMQITQVNNLAQIYRLDESAHSRINTFFMTCFFLGGAAGTAAGVAAWHAGGWPLVGWQLLLWCALALLVTIVSLRTAKA